MKSTIYGSCANSIVTLYRIHQRGCYFKKDTSTEHSQIKQIQTYLNNNGYNCGTADGKYGDNTGLWWFLFLICIAAPIPLLSVQMRK